LFSEIGDHKRATPKIRILFVTSSILLKPYCSFI
jgi:hypothetical protein